MKRKYGKRLSRLEQAHGTSQETVLAIIDGRGMSDEQIEKEAGELAKRLPPGQPIVVISR